MKTMKKLFPTYEVGSLPKLAARVKALQGQLLTVQDLQEVEHYGQKYSELAPAVELLQHYHREHHQLLPNEKVLLVDANALLNLRILESYDLDYVYDGEARRSEMYRHMAAQIQGFENYPEMLRSRGPDSWQASICAKEPRLKYKLEELPILKEFAFVEQHALSNIKVPLDDPYMIANMTGNKHYLEQLRPDYTSPQRLRYEAKRSLTLALAHKVIRPNVEVLAKLGALWIQLDIPAATLDPRHIPIMVEGINAVVEGIPDVKFSLHLCYPRRVSLTEKKGYDLLFPAILNLDENVNHLSLELANGNEYEKDLRIFAASSRRFEIGLGVVDITLEKQQQGVMETADEIRLRILKAAQLLGPEQIYVAPDCGLRQLSLERACRLLETLAAGTEIARKG